MMKNQKKNDKKKSITAEKLAKGIEIVKNHKIFKHIHISIIDDNRSLGKNDIAVADHNFVYVNPKYDLEPQCWAYAISHAMLHLILGHFDKENLPGYEIMKADGSKKWKSDFDKKLWSAACDIYIAKFLRDMKFGKPIDQVNLSAIPCSLSDEKKIYEYLCTLGTVPEHLKCDTAAQGMIGLENPIDYEDENNLWKSNWATDMFVDALAWAATDSVRIAGGGESLESYSLGYMENQSKNWFMSNFPLLGSIAAAFEIVMDYEISRREEIQVAAIDVQKGIIYINPAAKLSKEETRFVMAHELLHAGLQHFERRQGRNPFLWNVACDYVINGWLVQMQVGEMPEGCLYDELYIDWSAESIYEELIREIRKNQKLETLRGYGRGDIISHGVGKKCTTYSGMSLDEFCKSALAQGLEYHLSYGRGMVPAGLLEEIRALAMPVIPWDVELARWLDCFIPPLEKHRSYARPSRRQGTTLEIPRPRYVKQNVDEDGRTFGVIVDTSGSMSAKMIGMALGSIASYAAEREVGMIRVVFCDATAYDAGYLIAEEIAGRVEVKGRGGTILQPAVDLLEKAEDFPKDGPILIITDGEIEERMTIPREHAFLIPKGRCLPFRAKGKVFYFEENQ